MRRYIAILNPNADRGRAATRAEQLVDALGGAAEVALRRTTRPGEAEELAQAAAHEELDAVLAVGGDGTVHEVANGLLAVTDQGRPPLGIVPAGSGNDFAFAIGIGSDLDAAVAAINRNHPRTVDVGRIRSGDGRSQYFVNNVGMLLEGEINIASHRIRWPKGSGLYYRAALQTLLRPIRAAHLDLDVDGARVEVEALVLSICNGPRSGGKFLLVPDADVADGELDYMLMRPTGRLALLRMISSSVRGGDHLRHSAATTNRFVQMSVQSSIPLAAHVDGEPWMTPEQDVRRCDIQTLPQALQVLC